MPCPCPTKGSCPPVCPHVPTHHPHPPSAQGHHKWGAPWRVECRVLPLPIQAWAHDMMTSNVFRNLQFTKGFLLLHFTESSEQDRLCV